MELPLMSDGPLVGTVRSAERGFTRVVIVAASLGALQGCSTVIRQDSGPPPESVDLSSIPNAVPTVQPRSPYGNPDSYVVNGRRYYVMKSSVGYMARGIASWYGTKFNGQRTSDGETYNMYAMTAAHKTLPLPTYVQVTNLNNGKRVIVKVNDRGPFEKNRLIDLSYAAAAKLGILAAGTGLVQVRAIDPRTYRRNEVATSPSVPEGGVQGFYIQVGAFAYRRNAEHLVNRLSILGNILVNISETVVDGRPFYRVRIGPLSRVDVADRVVSNLDRLGIFDHQIVTH